MPQEPVDPLGSCQETTHDLHTEPQTSDTCDAVIVTPNNKYIQSNLKIANGNLRHMRVNIKVAEIRVICKHFDINPYTTNHKYKIKKDLITALKKYINE